MAGSIWKSPYIFICIELGLYSTLLGWTVIALIGCRKECVYTTIIVCYITNYLINLWNVRIYNNLNLFQHVLSGYQGWTFLLSSLKPHHLWQNNILWQNIGKSSSVISYLFSIVLMVIHYNGCGYYCHFLKGCWFANSLIMWYKSPMASHFFYN